MPICPRSSDRLERRPAKAEVAGAIPAVDAIFSGLWCNSSISACEADGPGANPGFLTTVLQLRNLANAAKLLEGNPGLMNLRLMQSLSAAQSAGNTLVLGMPAGFVPLKNGRSGLPPEAPA